MQKQNMGSPLTAHKVLGFLDSRDGYKVRLANAEGAVLTLLLRHLALNAEFISTLSPADALQVGFWLGAEVS